MQANSSFGGKIYKSVLINFVEDRLRRDGPTSDRFPRKPGSNIGG
jgi:hypothetical protein